ncbi:hypothetical protein [Pseudarthrobacter sp. NS4]|uniref:hypothetical protein n=1 Tax=Pseudarthrobacter sp. NS4 TaxID=2973976 RepID=UPI0021629667|nr:hypothetical protein [Pseudarthrobacter sp. NS4]
MAQLWGAAPERLAEDPQLRRMLATHIHCGEVMQLVAAGQPVSTEGQQGMNDGGVLTYRCACGFSFDKGED